MSDNCSTFWLPFCQKPLLRCITLQDSRSFSSMYFRTPEIISSRLRLHWDPIYIVGSILLTWFDSDSKIVSYIQYISLSLPTTQIIFIIFWLNLWGDCATRSWPSDTSNRFPNDLNGFYHFPKWSDLEHLGNDFPASFGKTDFKVRRKFLLKWRNYFNGGGKCMIKMFSCGGKPTLENDICGGVKPTHPNKSL